MEKNHTNAVKAWTFSPAYKKHITPQTSKKDKFFQVGHFVELLQLCSFGMYA
jgi:hypothetical protein